MLEELVYSAAQRALDQQSTSLSDLRTRTSTLVAAATLSASFLGAAAIGRGAPAWAVVLAMAPATPCPTRSWRGGSTTTP